MLPYQRHLAGSLDSGVTADIGELQPEEQAIFAKSKMIDGERIFTQEVNGFHFEGRKEGLTNLAAG